MQGVAKVRALIISSFVAATFVLAPAVVSAQSAFSGIVRDTSGAVLPGVTVEASSPVLIEKTRAAVTDGEGRYTITDLRPGHLRGRVHADRLQHLQARRPGAADELQHADQRRSARRIARRIHHRHRRRAGGRRGEHAAHAGAEPGTARRAPQRAQLLGAGGADAGRADVEHRRRRQPADGADLHDGARVASDRHHRAGRRAPAEQPDERRPGAGLLQRRGQRRR